MLGPYLQHKRYSSCSLPFCFLSVFGNGSIIAVSVRGFWGGWATTRLSGALCIWETRCQSKLQSKTVLTSPFFITTAITHVSEIIPQLFLRDTTGLHFHSFGAFVRTSAHVFSLLNWLCNCRAINTCQSVQKVNGPTTTNYSRGPDLLTGKHR